MNPKSNPSAPSWSKRVLAVLPLALLLTAVAANAQFTEWSAPVNLGPAVNSGYLDSCVAISKNGLSLFFSSNRQTDNADSLNRDLYVSRRETVEDDWGPPVALALLNTSAWESCPALSLDEHRLYFTRPGSCGNRDVWVSPRQSRREDVIGWEPPVQLACAADGEVNSPAHDQTPALFEDESGKVLMYFASSRSGAFAIYQSELREDDTFGPATAVVGLNTSTFESGPVVRRDGLEVIFQSARDGFLFAFYVATRASTEDPWSEPVRIPTLGLGIGGRIALSFDGRELYFTSARPGGNGYADLYVARRERLHGKRYAKEE